MVCASTYLSLLQFLSPPLESGCLPCVLKSCAHMEVSVWGVGTPQRQSVTDCAATPRIIFPLPSSLFCFFKEISNGKTCLLSSCYGSKQLRREFIVSPLYRNLVAHGRGGESKAKFRGA